MQNKQLPSTSNIIITSGICTEKAAASLAIPRILNEQLELKSAVQPSLL